MADDEVELKGENDDFEVVPLGPIRKLEKRVDRLQEQSQNEATRDEELIRDVLDIMKSNQKIVNDMTESTHELKNSVEDLTHKMDQVVENMNSFMDLLQEASEIDMEGEVMQDMQGRISDAIGNEMEEMADAIKQSNQRVVENLQQLNENLEGNSFSNNRPQMNNQQNQPNQQPQQNQRTQQSGNKRRNQMNSNQGTGNNSDRVSKLKEKFNSDN